MWGWPVASVLPFRHLQPLSHSGLTANASEQISRVRLHSHVHPVPCCQFFLKHSSDFVTALHFYQFHLDCKLPKDTNYTHLYFLCCYDSQIWWGTYLKCDSMILAIKDGSGRTRMRSGTCLLFPDKYSQETVALGVHWLDTENHSLLNLAGT